MSISTATFVAKPIWQFSFPLAVSMPSFFFFNNFISVFLAMLELCCCKGSLVVASGGYSSCNARSCHSSGFFCCRAWTLGCLDFSRRGVWAQPLWHMGLAACGMGGSPQIRDWIHVPAIDRWILYHWATREALPTFWWRHTGCFQVLCCSFLCFVQLFSWSEKSLSSPWERIPCTYICKVMRAPLFSHVSYWWLNHHKSILTRSILTDQWNIQNWAL